MTLTPRGAALLGGALLLWLVARLLGVNELYVVAVAAAVLVAGAAIAVRLNDATISVRRTVTQPRVRWGSSTEMVVELRNDAPLPASLLLVEDECPAPLASGTRFVVPGIAPRSVLTLRYPLHGEQRGRYRVGPLRIRMRDPFGVVERVARYRASADVIVYPRVEPLSQGLGRGSYRGSGTSDMRRLFNTGDEFYTMREYATGDDLRQVHWPSTAHRQTLMVRQQELAWQAQATVFCDTRAYAHRGNGTESTLERAVSVAASLVWHLADHGYQLRLATEADVAVPESQPWTVLLDRLAELRSSRLQALAPSLTRLRADSAEGLLAAVLAPPVGGGAVSRDPDTRALLLLGRKFSGRLAVVIETGRSASGRPGRTRAQELATLLNSAGWKATVVAPGEDFAQRWRLLVSAGVGARVRTPAGAQPGDGRSGVA